MVSKKKHGAKEKQIVKVKFFQLFHEAKNVSAWAQLVSIPLSYLSLIISSARLFFSQRLGIYSDPDPPLFNIILISPLVVVQSFGILSCWVIVAAYLLEKIVFCVAVVVAVAFAAVYVVVMKGNLENRVTDAIHSRVPPQGLFFHQRSIIK